MFSENPQILVVKTLTKTSQIINVTFLCISGTKNSNFYSNSRYWEWKSQQFTQNINIRSKLESHTQKKGKYILFVKWNGLFKYSTSNKNIYFLFLLYFIFPALFLSLFSFFTYFFIEKAKSFSNCTRIWNYDFNQIWSWMNHVSHFSGWIREILYFKLHNKKWKSGAQRWESLFRFFSKIIQIKYHVE